MQSYFIIRASPLYFVWNHLQFFMQFCTHSAYARTIKTTNVVARDEGKHSALKIKWK